MHLVNRGLKEMMDTTVENGDPLQWTLFLVVGWEKERHGDRT